MCLESGVSLSGPGKNLKSLKSVTSEPCDPAQPSPISSCSFPVASGMWEHLLLGRLGPSERSGRGII